MDNKDNTVNPVWHTDAPHGYVAYNKPITIRQSPPASDWKCYLFGNTPDGGGMVYTPSEGNLPNWFVRYMMKICLGCTWVKEK